jgi:TolB protein
LRTINPDGTQDADLLSTFKAAQDPQWSPDGRKIAFTSDFGGWVVNADGTGLTQLPAGVRGHWSPDGLQFTFQQDFDIWKVNVDGTGLTRLTADAVDNDPGCGDFVELGTCEYNTDPDWSSLNRIVFTHVAYTCDEGSCSLDANDLHVINPDGSGRFNVTQGQTSEPAFPDWSPDGSKIVFGTFNAAYVINADGTSYHQVGGGGARNVWSPDQSKVAFSRGLYGDLYTMSADGTSETPLTADGNSNFDEYPDWQPLRPPGYARPIGATPTKVWLVPAYKPCTSSNASHGAPLTAVSCNPPQQTSGYLTVGTADANGKATLSKGSVTFEILCNPPGPNRYPPCTDPGDQIDVALTASVTDVRNKVGLTDYAGELRTSVVLRITDRFNGAGGVHPATVTDTPFRFIMACQPTADTAIGSTCSTQTSADALMPGLALEGKRAVWELDQIQVYDGGADGDADTAGDNTLFMDQGLFAP